MEMVRNSAEKDEERLLGEIKLGEHLRREEDKDREHVRCTRTRILGEMPHQFFHFARRLGNVASCEISGRSKWASSTVKGLPQSK